MIENDRVKIRDCFRQIKDDDQNIHLKDYLITMCPNITETKFDDEQILKKRVSIINAILNRKLFKKKITKIPKSEKIVFYNFIENSLNKNLIHTHSLMRIPRKFINMLKKIFQLLIDIVKEKFKFEITIHKRPKIAINYMTKKFSQNNDRFFVS
jgi:hypothetical protein|tara:strand:- start:4 stop:465 length:462 start_codon:yes stop_codon:yes gene_type:complete